MRLIKRLNVIEDSKRFPEDIQDEVKVWCNIVESSNWRHLDDIRKTYKRSVDKVGNFLVFNIKDCRLIVGFNFKSQTFFYKYFLTHKEYDLKQLKKNPYFKKYKR
ncbi:MAG: type II toxin-antitoxin system HigB family toxin [Cyanobacteriota bacterium]|nr:type II toxin-antitoxin system HigB family toxin [Cyanobacteriota bacterium]